MKITGRPGDPGGVEMRLAIVQKGEQASVYFLPPGTNKAQLNAPHFVVAPGTYFGDLDSLVYDMNQRFSEFVCRDFADGEELKRLRAENAKLRRGQIDERELEGLRTAHAELERLREEKREAASLRTRLAELEGPDDAA